MSKYLDAGLKTAKLNKANARVNQKTRLDKGGGNCSVDQRDSNISNRMNTDS